MDDSQYTNLLNTMVDIKTSQGRIEQKIDSHLDDDDRVHARQDKAITVLVEKQNVTEKTMARHRGIALGVTGVFSVLLAIIKLDYWR